VHTLYDSTKEAATSEFTAYEKIAILVLSVTYLSERLEVIVAKMDGVRLCAFGFC
jgi:hypothetical protein